MVLRCTCGVADSLAWREAFGTLRLVGLVKFPVLALLRRAFPDAGRQPDDAGPDLPKGGREVRKISLALGISAILAVLFVNRFAPEKLDADLILMSIMSLQNVTLFYWGQNRLANVLPLAVSFIRDPAANLFALMVLATAAHFVLLFLIARGVSQFLRLGGHLRLAEFQIFAVLCLATLLLIEESVSYALIIAHPEYSMAAALIGIALILAVQAGALRSIRWALAALCIFVAIGINFAAVIPMTYAAGIVALMAARFRLRAIAVVGMTMASAYAWSLLSAAHGQSRYAGFSLQGFRDGILPTLSNLRLDFDPAGAAFVAVIIVFGALSLFRHWGRQAEMNGRIAFVFAAVVAFSIGWIVLFSSNEWVATNGHASRYFVFATYGLVLLCAFGIAGALTVGRSGRWEVVTFAALAFAIAALVRSPVAFSDYAVFRKVNVAVPQPVGLYAGDYWVAWPAVMRDLLADRSAYGLGYRAEGNGAAARAAVAAMAASAGAFPVVCLEAAQAECRRQVSAVVGPVDVVQASAGAPSGTAPVLAFALATAISYRGAELGSLPSKSGAFTGTHLETNGTAGCLFFGPYTRAWAGRYRLVVEGRATRLAEAVVDVTSRTGRVQHVAFALNGPGEEGRLLDREVLLAEEISDLEIRLCVGSQDVLSVHGYTFAKIP